MVIFITINIVATYVEIRRFVCSCRRRPIYLSTFLTAMRAAFHNRTAITISIDTNTITSDILVVTSFVTISGLTGEGWLLLLLLRCCFYSIGSSSGGSKWLLLLVTIFSGSFFMLP